MEAQAAHRFDFIIHQEELPERDVDRFRNDLDEWRYVSEAYCLSILCMGDVPCPMVGLPKTAPRGRVFCPDCGHALVWRTCKVARLPMALATN